MLIIVDGYNLIRQSDFLRCHEKQSLKSGRQALIINLSEYKRKKGHNIIVVFDGWENGSAQEERDRQGNINIIYSRRGEKADDVIKRLADKSPEEIIVISSDREIASYVTRCGKTAVSSIEFATLMRKAIIESSLGEFAVKKEADGVPSHNSPKKGPAKRLPRAKRYKQTKIKKL